MPRTIRTFRLFASIAALATSVLMATPTPLAHAVGPHTWWVATSGSAASPSSAGSSCANPGFVGATATSIQAAIAAATAGDLIKICTGTYAIGTTIEIDKNITLTGSGTTIPILDGGSTNRIISIATGGLTVTMNELHFQNGRLTADNEMGAAIKAAPTTILSVSDSYFFQNRATGVGGAGGAIAMLGDTSAPGAGSLNITRSSFYKNHGYDGGAIAMAGVSGLSTVSDSTFVSNSAHRAGGAISASFANLTASHTTFVDNTNVDTGFASATWVVTMKGNIVANSPAVSLTHAACYFENSVPSDNVSTDAACLANNQTPVSYSSLNLGFLAPHGARVPTLPIGASSSAIDAVSTPANCSGTDQTGHSRSGNPCDAGSSEYVAGRPSISPSSTITLVKGRPITNAPTFSASGFTGSVTYRIATEVGDPLPGGALLDSSNGTISGTPTETSGVDSHIITASDGSGATASAKLIIDNCILSQSNGKYVVATVGDLEIFRTLGCGRSAAYLQTANISWNGPWQGTTSQSSPFTGSYDGGGRSITGLQISGGETAFIAHTNGATISNLRFTAAVTGSYASAGLVRLAKSTTITAVRGSGTVSNPPTESNQGCIGGLVGETDVNSVITNSSYEGTIDAPTASWNGGLVGCAYSGTVIENSYFRGTVNGLDNIGGLVGWMDSTEVRNSYAVGSVLGTRTENGGLVGWLGGDGSDADSIAVQNSYASVNIHVQGATSIGGLIGAGPSTSVSSSYWEAGLTGVDGLNPIGSMSDQGGTQPALSPVPAASMKTHTFFDTASWSILNGWSIPTSTPKIWGICDGQERPFLMWEHTSNPCAAAQDPAPEQNNPPASNPSPGESSTPTTAPTTSTTTSSPSTTQSSPSTTVSPTTTSNAPATSTPSPMRLSSVNDAKVGKGGIAIFNGKVQVTSSLSWSDNSAISGTIGDVNLALVFDPLMIDRALPKSYVAGSSFTLSLRGLKPGSSTSATLFSTPRMLGRYTAAANGTISALITIPSDAPAGSHRLRLKMVDRNGRPITVWLGIAIRSTPETLPATGSSNGKGLSLAVWLTLAGIGFSGASQCRSRMRKAKLHKN